MSFLPDNTLYSKSINGISLHDNSLFRLFFRHMYGVIVVSFGMDTLFQIFLYLCLIFSLLPRDRSIQSPKRRQKVSKEDSSYIDLEEKYRSHSEGKFIHTNLVNVNYTNN